MSYVPKIELLLTFMSRGLGALTHLTRPELIDDSQSKLHSLLQPMPDTKTA